MAVHCAKRHGALGIAAAAALLLIFIVLDGQTTTPIVLAQTTEKDARYPISVSPPLPGAVSSVEDPGTTAPIELAPIPGTPVPVAEGGVAPPPNEGNSMTTSLGGSDVAVSSVGGSYEVDGRARKKSRHARQTPAP